MRTPEESDAVSQVKHRHGNSVASLPCAHANKFIIYITIHKLKAHIYKLTSIKAPKHSRFRLTDTREKIGGKLVEFSMIPHGRWQ